MKNRTMRGSSRGVSKFTTPGKSQRMFKTTEMRCIMNANLNKRTEQPTERRELILNNQNRIPLNISSNPAGGKGIGPIKI